MGPDRSDTSTYNSSATIYVTNDTDGDAYISFSHEYSDDGPQVWEGGNVIQPGGNAGPLTVGFNTGFLYTGQDYWFCLAHVLDGPNPGIYYTDGSIDQPIVQCTLESVDNGGTLYFSVTTEVFTMAENSGACTTPMTQGDVEELRARTGSREAKVQPAR